MLSEIYTDIPNTYTHTPTDTPHTPHTHTHTKKKKKKKKRDWNIRFATSSFIKWYVVFNVTVTIFLQAHSNVYAVYTI